MKNKYHILLGFLFTLVFITFGCTNDPVTVATSADGVEIVFSNQGKGDPAILLVHGWTNNTTLWDLQIPFLSEKYQVIAVDLAGHGKSGNNRTDWTMSAFGEDIAAVVHAANLKNVILVGFSMGGPAILEASKNLKEQVSGLILVESIKNPGDKIPPHVIPLIDSTFMDLIENPTAAKAVKLGFFMNNPAESMKKINAMLDRDRSGWRECLHENFRWSNEDCIKTLETIDRPLISINSDNTPTAVDHFKSIVPSYKAKFLSGTGHLVMWDVTEEFNRLLEESIQDILSAD